MVQSSCPPSASGIGKKVPVLIEIDGGLHRSGVPPYEGAVAFADSIRDLPGLEICGLMYYGGLIYAETTREGYEAQTKREHDELVGTAELLRAKGYRMDVLSGGNSIPRAAANTSRASPRSAAATISSTTSPRWRPALLSSRRCALRAVSTVVCKMDDHHAIIDAGSKTLTTDLCGHRPGYGWVVGHPRSASPSSMRSTASSRATNRCPLRSATRSPSSRITPASCRIWSIRSTASAMAASSA